ncbi:uncharacterized protein LOC128265971 [Drosophila gunungcola]|uniref:uncharacterized protein LOC128265971 n=1 Tax=Drosophila gunungcola TaxID=103775 RepID=UPI0022E5D47A|nr:uncharacterized protein LOC128265971 [Drosophila gunungcola]
MKKCRLKSACTSTGAVVRAIFMDSTASCAPGLKENFLFPVFFKDSVSGAANVAKFFINRRYQPAVIRKALTSFMVLGSGIRLMAATRPGSIRRRPPPTMKPRHSATRRRYFIVRKALPETGKEADQEPAVYSLLLVSNSICQKANFKTTLEMKYVWSILERKPAMLGSG